MVCDGVLLGRPLQQRVIATICWSCSAFLLDPQNKTIWQREDEECSLKLSGMKGGMEFLCGSFWSSIGYFYSRLCLL